MEAPFALKPRSQRFPLHDLADMADMADSDFLWSPGGFFVVAEFGTAGLGPPPQGDEYDTSP